MKYLSLIFIAFFICTCSSSNEKVLKKANEIYDQSIKIEKEVAKKYDSLEQVSNSINIQGRALTEEEIKFTREVELLGLSLDYWQENHIEVPTSEDLEKNNRSPVKFSAQDILSIQKEFNDSILALQIRLNKLSIPSN
jgi:hypothetical protein